jgi:putative Holliday junction resolvase
VAGEAARADPPNGADLDEIAALVRELGVVEVVVGLPLRLGGGEGPAAQAARRYAVAVARRVAPVGVRLVDERLSTVTATRALREAGRRQRRARPVVDQAAAVVILQAALDSERTTGRAPGVRVEVG